MSQENVELVLESLRRAEANDVEGAAALMHPEITGRRSRVARTGTLCGTGCRGRGDRTPD